MKSSTRKTVDSPRVVVVTDQVALHQSISRSDVAYVAHEDAGDLIDLAKRKMPAVLVVDLTDANLVRDFERAARVLSRCAATQTVQMVAVVPPGFTESWQSKIRSAGAFDLVLHPIQSEHLDRAIDRADARSNEIVAARLALDLRRTCPTKPVEQNKSLLVRAIQCPMHDGPQPLSRYILRVGAIVTDIDFFDMPVYKSATQGKDFVDFHLLGVMVCPRCLLASNDPRYFTDLTDRGEPHVYNAATRQQLRGTISARHDLAGVIPESFHTHARTVEEAVVAYELAMHTSRTLYECNRFSLQIELARMGNYHLRLVAVKQLRSHGISQDERVAHYRAALDLLGEAFVVVEGPILFKVAYQVVALSIALGEDAGAYRYIARLTQMQREALLEKQERAALDRYLLRCQTAWEDRDEHRVVPPAESQAA